MQRASCKWAPCKQALSTMQPAPGTGHTAPRTTQHASCNGAVQAAPSTQKQALSTKRRASCTMHRASCNLALCSSASYTQHHALLPCKLHPTPGTERPATPCIVHAAFCLHAPPLQRCCSSAAPPPPQHSLSQSCAAIPYGGLRPFARCSGKGGGGSTLKAAPWAKGGGGGA